MKLLIIDNSSENLNYETLEFMRQLGTSCSVFSSVKESYKKEEYYSEVNLLDPISFIETQAKYDAILVIDISKINKDINFRIPYFYNIYRNTYDIKLENDYSFFSNKYGELQGASAVFVNDSKLNKFSNWLGLNSYFINKPVDTYFYKYASKKFLVPKLHIGYIPSSSGVDSYRDRIIEDVWSAAKSNWVMHTSESIKCIKNKINYTFDSSFDFSQFYKNIHVLVNPEDIYHKDACKSYLDYSKEAMSQGVVSLTSNQRNINSDYLFDKVHYFRISYSKPNEVLDTLRYVDKRRSKLSRMSYLGSKYIERYYGIKNIVQNKIQIIKNNI